MNPQSTKLSLNEFASCYILPTFEDPFWRRRLHGAFGNCNLFPFWHGNKVAQVFWDTICAPNFFPLRLLLYPTVWKRRQRRRSRRSYSSLKTKTNTPSCEVRYKLRTPCMLQKFPKRTWKYYSRNESGPPKTSSHPPSWDTQHEYIGRRCKTTVETISLRALCCSCSKTWKHCQRANKTIFAILHTRPEVGIPLISTYLSIGKHVPTASDHNKRKATWSIGSPLKIDWMGANGLKVKIGSFSFSLSISDLDFYRCLLREKESQRLWWLSSCSCKLLLLFPLGLSCKVMTGKIFFLALLFEVKKLYPLCTCFPGWPLPFNPSRHSRQDLQDQTQRFEQTERSFNPMQNPIGTRRCSMVGKQNNSTNDIGVVIRKSLSNNSKPLMEHLLR